MTNTQPAGGDRDTTVHLRPLGGPTAVLEIAGIRLLTDPTFDPPGEYPTGRGFSLVKTAPPALSPDDIGSIDIVLLSHDQHADNLDNSGRLFLSRAPTVLTTVAGAARLGKSTTGLPPWTSQDFARSDGHVLRITSVPAQHGPDGTEGLTGEVTGFVLAGSGLPTIYVSGDNASLRVVQEIASRIGPIDVAILFAGGAQIPPMGDSYLTLNSARAAEAAEMLGAVHVVPLHFEGWQHFSEGRGELEKAFQSAGIANRLLMPRPGTRVSVAMPAPAEY